MVVSKTAWDTIVTNAVQFDDRFVRGTTRYILVRLHVRCLSVRDYVRGTDDRHALVVVALL